MNCRQCGHENRPGAKFCARCRAVLQRLCPECGSEVAAGDRFCSECAATLSTATAMRPRAPRLAEHFTILEEALPASMREHLFTQADGENRLLTILFADLTSPVKLTGSLRPEDAAALVNDVLKAMVDAVLEYGGRINRLLGDAVLAFFGTPEAHEDDPLKLV